MKTHGATRKVLVATLALGVTALLAGAEEEVLPDPQANQEQEQEEADPIQPDHPQRRQQDQNRERDHRPEILLPPGPSAEERARDALEPHAPRPVPWVDPGPSVDVDHQIETVDELLPDTPGVVGKITGGYSYCGTGCGGAQTPRKRGQDEWYITCFENTKDCKARGKDCACAVFKTKKGGTDREYHSDGNEKGQIRIPSKEAGTHEWYCYCVDD
jgi:hypothetical protein